MPSGIQRRPFIRESKNGWSPLHPYSPNIAQLGATVNEFFKSFCLIEVSQALHAMRFHRTGRETRVS